MASDSDSDVVFENSPLYHHLQDCGIDDATYETKAVLRNQLERTADCQKSSPRWLKIYLGNLFGSMMISFSWINAIRTKVGNDYRQNFVNLIVDSKVLTEEDIQYLYNVGNIDKKKMECKYKHINPSSWILKGVIFSCVVAYFFNRVIYPEFYWKFKIIMDIAVILTTSHLVFDFLKSFVFRLTMWHINRTKVLLSDILAINSHMLKCSEKSLRLIQESELVVRGFTLISQQSPVWRLEQGNLHKTQRHCPQLRSSLFSITKEVMLIFKSETSFLLSNYPIHSELDSVMNYLACVPLEEYGACLQITGHDKESKEELLRVTDGYSIAALKGMRQLYVLQQSEYFRRLALTYYGCDLSLEANLLTLTKLKNKIKKQFEDLQRSYECHSCVILNNETEDAKLPKDLKQSPAVDVYTAIHSLDLHLQSSLLRVRSLAAILEHKFEQEDGSSIQPSDKSFNDIVQQIKQELFACKGCWEEGLNRLEKLEKKESEIPHVQKLTKPQTSDSELIEKQIHLVGMSEPVIEDEVFEAYIHEQEEFEQGNGGWDEFLTPEEKAKKKKEKEEALRVLSELKNVISHRAVEREQRENIALQKSANRSENALNHNIINPDKSVGDYRLDKEETNRKMGEVGNLTLENGKVLCSEQCYHTDRNYAKESNSNCRVCFQDESKSDNLDCVLHKLLSHQNHDEVKSVERYSKLPQQSLTFTANLAAMVAARSQMMGLEEQTFGDDDDDDDDDVVKDIGGEIVVEDNDTIEI